MFLKCETNETKETKQKWPAGFPTAILRYSFFTLHLDYMCAAAPHESNFLR